MPVLRATRRHRKVMPRAVSERVSCNRLSEDHTPMCVVELVNPAPWIGKERIHGEKTRRKNLLTRCTRVQHASARQVRAGAFHGGGLKVMLNDRAREILSFIQRFARERGYPPTIREIGREYGISSTNGVRYYLNLLEKAGYLRRSERISRGIEGVSKPAPRGGIPILGRVAAGQPILAEESLEGTLEPGEMFGDASGLFALRVRGDSMIEAGILAGDYVVVRQQEKADSGDIVVALRGEEATVKYYRPGRGRAELVPANPAYEPIAVDAKSGFRILGVVRGVIRTLSH